MPTIPKGSELWLPRLDPSPQVKPPWSGLLPPAVRHEIESLAGEQPQPNAPVSSRSSSRESLPEASSQRSNGSSPQSTTSSLPSSHPLREAPAVAERSHEREGSLGPANRCGWCMEGGPRRHRRARVESKAWARRPYLLSYSPTLPRSPRCFAHVLFVAAHLCSSCMSVSGTPPTRPGGLPARNHSPCLQALVRRLRLLQRDRLHGTQRCSRSCDGCVGPARGSLRPATQPRRRAPPRGGHRAAAAG